MLLLNRAKFKDLPLDEGNKLSVPVDVSWVEEKSVISATGIPQRGFWWNRKEHLGIQALDRKGKGPFKGVHSDAAVFVGSKLCSVAFPG